MPYWLIRPIAWLVIRTGLFLLGGMRIEGREHVPHTRGVLITPNHISDMDPPTIAVALPRACWFMAKEEIFAMKVIGPLARWLHGFPVKRYTADRAALRRAESLLKEGEAVVIFPEGKVSRDGALQPILPGILLIARDSGAPIVPAVLIGTDTVLPYGKQIPRRTGRPVVVRFGPPITAEHLMGNAKGSDALKTGAERLREILRALQRGLPYPDFEATMSPVCSSPASGD